MRRPTMARGGKYVSQCAGEEKSLICSSVSPMLRMISHWYLAPPVLAATFDCNHKRPRDEIERRDGRSAEAIGIKVRSLNSRSTQLCIQQHAELHMRLRPGACIPSCP